jgi:hypothetical protein
MAKKDKTYQPTQLILTRNQVEKLAKIVENFTEIEDFMIEETHESGIGNTVRVRFKMFDKNDTIVDITDVSNW